MHPRFLLTSLISEVKIEILFVAIENDGGIAHAARKIAVARGTIDGITGRDHRTEVDEVIPAVPGDGGADLRHGIVGARTNAEVLLMIPPEDRPLGIDPDCLHPGGPGINAVDVDRTGSAQMKLIRAVTPHWSVARGVQGMQL